MAKSRGKSLLIFIKILQKMSIQINQTLDDFTLPSVLQQTISEFTLSAFLRQQRSQNANFKGFVLFFYPKDQSKCCITEVQSFSALYQDFLQNNVEIIGISRDSIKSHQNFAVKQNIPFAILSDQNQQLCDTFDVIIPKIIFGKQVFGVERCTFFISSDAKIIQQWRKVKTPGHAENVLNFVKNL